MTYTAYTNLSVKVKRLDDEQRYSFGVVLDGAFVEFHSRPAGGGDAAIAEAKAAANPPAPEPVAGSDVPAAAPAQQLSDEGAAAEVVEPVPLDEPAEPGSEPDASSQG